MKFYRRWRSLTALWKSFPPFAFAHVTGPAGDEREVYVCVCVCVWVWESSLFPPGWVLFSSGLTPLTHDVMFDRSRGLPQERTHPSTLAVSVRAGLSDQFVIRKLFTKHRKPFLQRLLHSFLLSFRFFIPIITQNSTLQQRKNTQTFCPLHCL